MAEYKRQTEEYKKQTEKEMADYKKQMEKRMNEMLQAVTKANDRSPLPSPRLELSSPEDTEQRSPGSFCLFWMWKHRAHINRVPREDSRKKRQLWNHGRPTM